MTGVVAEDAAGGEILTGETLALVGEEEPDLVVVVAAGGIAGTKDGLWMMGEVSGGAFVYFRKLSWFVLTRGPAKSKNREIAAT